MLEVLHPSISKCAHHRLEASWNDEIVPSQIIPLQWQVRGWSPFKECKQSTGILCHKAVAIESNQLAQNDHQHGVTHQTGLVQ